MSYADDLILLANTPVGLQDLIAGQRPEARGFERGGLELNPRKSATLSIAMSVRHSAWAVAPEQFFANGERLPVLGIESAYKYLGLNFAAAGSRVEVYETLDRALESLRSAPLKPQQRLYALRVALLPRFYHQLVLGRVRAGMFRRLDVKVHAFVRKMLRLPPDLTLGAFYAPVREGGLGLPLLEVSARLWRKNRLERMLAADEPAARVIASLSACDSLLREIDAPIIFEQKHIPSKRELERFMAERLHRSVDCAGLHESSFAPSSTRWVGSGAAMCSGSHFISSLQTRYNVLSTPAREARRGGVEGPMCGGGCGARGTLAHIVQSCPITHGLRITRHDFILSKLEGDIAEGGRAWVLAREPSLRTEEGVRKPDLLLTDEHNNITVVDVQVVSDQNLAVSTRKRGGVTIVNL